MATHETAARQSPLHPQHHVVRRDARREQRRDALFKGIGHAVVRHFRAGGGDQFLLQFHEIHIHSNFPDAQNLRAVTNTSLCAIFATIFRISARARNARTFTSGTDQPVSSAISFTERSSISSNVMTSRAGGESFSSTRSMSNFAASACSLPIPARRRNAPASRFPARSIRKTTTRGCAGGRAKNRSKSAPSSA